MCKGVCVRKPPSLPPSPRTLVHGLVDRDEEHALGCFDGSTFGGNQIDDELLGVDQVLSWEGGREGRHGEAGEEDGGK